jgi:hypothetical protein
MHPPERAERKGSGEEKGEAWRLHKSRRILLPAGTCDDPASRAWH